ncbi:MAG: DUF1176 domain-containing protein [Bdellovibrionales bacterium]
MKTLLILPLFFLTQISHADTLISLSKALELHKALYSDSCDLLADLPIEPDLVTLSPKTDLIFIPCMLGAYQGSHMGYIVKKNQAPQVISVLAYDSSDEVKGLVASQDLVGYDFDPDTGVLSTYSKGRGLGDCGQSSKSIIAENSAGYVSVKTIEIRHKNECDLNYDTKWTIVFKQD